MDKEKQIEEFADDIDEAIDNNMTWHDIDGITNIDTVGMANELKNKGYRKERQGEWKIMKMGDGDKVRTCSACMISQTVNVYKGKVMFNYCPYCGAKMKGE